MIHLTKKRYSIFTIVSILFYIIVLSLLYSNRFESYIFYERIKFQSTGATIYANLYHPSESVNFQNKSPLVIFAHGLGSQKDIDIRIPNELTKRGFYVASIDYRGNGESTGHILDINHELYQNRTNVPAIAQDCSKLLDVIEKMPVYDNINKSQIAIIGHSLGGMVALMSATLDERFKVTITWAGLVNFSANLFGISEDNPFMNYIPSRLINTSNPSNLLIIQSIYDTTVPYKQNTLVAYKLTNCTLINITQHLLGDPHYLFSDKVLIKTINWLELNFFHSENINGSIHLSYKTSLILLLLGILALFLTSLGIIENSTRVFFKRKVEMPQEIENNFNEISDGKIKIIVKKISKIFIYFSGFIFIWIFFYSFLGIYGIVFAPISIISIYFVAILIKFILTAERKREKFIFYIRSRLKNEIKSQIHKNVLLYSFFSVIIFLVLYITYSIFYPFAFFSPINFVDFILTYSIYPFYLAIELFYRKVIYPHLSFIKSPNKKTSITCVMAITNVLILMILSRDLFVITSVVVTYLVFLAVIIINSLIYENTNKFSSVLIGSFIIIQIFFGSAISSILGIGSIIQIFI